MYAQHYSNAYYHAPLPAGAPQPQYYVQYPPVYYQPVVHPAPPSPGKPKKVHRYNAPPPPVKLNPFLDMENRGTKDSLIWDVSQPLEAARRILNSHKMGELSDRHYNQLATDPPVPVMWIISNDFEQRLKVKGVPGGITIGHVLQAIHLGLRGDLEEEEWLDRSEDERILIHENRCVRLGKEAADFEIESQIRKIDALLDKTLFCGIKQVGPPENYEFELKLGKLKPKEVKGKGKAAWWN